ncbi:hypothetical protein [Microcoleus sp. K4-C2]|uniref:hypothetical protein n=1 Tax=Microcoleus sp. K4-C2 TaxID=2818792 RepID=UPI002FD1DDA6
MGNAGTLPAFSYRLETRYTYDELNRLTETVMPDLTPNDWVEGVTRAFVQRRPDGTIKISFPVEDSYTP